LWIFTTIALISPIAPIPQMFLKPWEFWQNDIGVEQNDIDIAQNDIDVAQED